MLCWRVSNIVSFLRRRFLVTVELIGYRENGGMMYERHSSAHLSGKG
jgi:hypothetical protein